MDNISVTMISHQGGFNIHDCGGRHNKVYMKIEVGPQWYITQSKYCIKYDEAHKSSTNSKSEFQSQNRSQKLWDRATKYKITLNDDNGNKNKCNEKGNIGSGISIQHTPPFYIGRKHIECTWGCSELKVMYHILLWCYIYTDTFEWNHFSTYTLYYNILLWVLWIS